MKANLRMVACIDALLHLLPLAAVLLSPVAMAADAATSGTATSGNLDGLLPIIQHAATNVSNKLVSKVTLTLSAGLILQLLISNWKDVIAGQEMSNLIARFTGLVLWGSLCFWLLNHLSLLSTMFIGYLALAGSIAGANGAPVNFSPGDVFLSGVALSGIMIKGYASGFVHHPLSALMGQASGFGTSMMLVAILLVIVAYAVIALSVLVAQVEFWLLFSVAPIAVAMLGLTAFRDQGIAPLKGVISLGMRIILLGTIISISSDIAESAGNAFSDPNLNTGYFSGIWINVAGSAACAVFALMSGKIAGAIASGTASFHGTDAIKGGMQLVQTAASLATAGAAGVGALALAGKGAATGLASGAGRMADMFSSGLSVTGGSGSGLGGPLPTRPTSAGAAPTPQPSPATRSGSPSGTSSGSSKTNSSLGSPLSSSTGSSSATDATIGAAGNASTPKPSVMDHLKTIGEHGQKIHDGLASHDGGNVGISINTRGE